jgi:hypothetical protein
LILWEGVVKIVGPEGVLTSIGVVFLPEADLTGVISILGFLESLFFVIEVSKTGFFFYEEPYTNIAF